MKIAHTQSVQNACPLESVHTNVYFVLVREMTAFVDGRILQMHAA